MDLMSIRRGLMAQMAGGKIPSFMNHLESGQFSNDTTGDYDIQLQNIAEPKGVLIYSNDFSMYDAKSDKTKLGAYGALFIAPSDMSQAQTVNGWVVCSANAFYFTNWGQNTSHQNASARNSRTETRGILYYRPSTKEVRIRGFGTGEYDFQLNTTYNWIVWD
jgi:hypothetical protein